MKTIYGIFVNSTRRAPYAGWIVSGLKTIETRNRNMLGKLVGERVSIIATGTDHKPMIVGSAIITKAMHVTQEEFETYRDETMIEHGDTYDCGEKGKWLYFMTDSKANEPIPLDYFETVYHGRSYCELYI